MAEFQNELIIPNCSICMEELHKDMVATKCGHVFHDSCLYNNLEYRNECPNCKTRIQKPQLYSLNFEIQKPKHQEELKKLLNTLTTEEKNQIDTYIQMNANFLKQNESLKSQNQIFKDQLNYKIEEYKKLQEFHEKTKILYEQSEKKQNQLQIKYNSLEIQNQELMEKEKLNKDLILDQRVELIELKSIRQLKEQMDKEKGGKSEQNYLDYINKLPINEQIVNLKNSVIMKDAKLNQIQNQNEILKKDIDTNKKRYQKQDQEIQQLLQENKKLKLKFDKQKYKDTSEENLRKINPSKQIQKMNDQDINENENQLPSNDQTPIYNKQLINQPFPESSFKINDIIKKNENQIQKTAKPVQSISQMLKKNIIPKQQDQQSQLFSIFQNKQKTQQADDQIIKHDYRKQIFFLGNKFE